MSEKIETKYRTAKDTIHHFYCDNCEKYLGYATEHEGGYYHNPHEVSIKFYAERLGWRYLNKCFCNDCHAELLNNLDSQLRELGFTDKEYQDD